MVFLLLFGRYIRLHLCCHHLQRESWAPFMVHQWYNINLVTLVLQVCHSFIYGCFSAGKFDCRIFKNLEGMFSNILLDLAGQVETEWLRGEILREGRGRSWPDPVGIRKAKTCRSPFFSFDPVVWALQPACSSSPALSCSSSVSGATHPLQLILHLSGSFQAGLDQQT